MAKILVINDEPGILETLDKMFRPEGHEVIRAHRGRTGVNLFQWERPHVTILDLKLPDGHGLPVLQEIRALEPTAQIIILTGFGITVEEECLARVWGVTEFVQKRFSLHTLRATLDRALKQSGRTM